MSAQHGHFAYRKCGSDPVQEQTLGPAPWGQAAGTLTPSLPHSEALIAVAVSVQAHPDRYFKKEGWLPTVFFPWGAGVVSCHPLRERRVRSAGIEEVAGEGWSQRKGKC